MQDKIQEIMGLVDEFALICAEEGGDDDYKHKVINHRRSVQSKLSELVREPLSHDDANKLWEDCLKKYKRPGPYELIVEFCNITNTSN